jgi:CBS domain-containing protein
MTRRSLRGPLFSLLVERSKAMRARDIMQSHVITVKPDTTVADIARLLIEHKIGAVPVVEYGGDLLGIVSESDLLHRAELGTSDRDRARWLTFFVSDQQLADEYRHAHGKRARDVMVSPPITVEVEATVAGIVDTMERNRVRRVLVIDRTRGGKTLAGIVARSDLVRALATLMPELKEHSVQLDDRRIRDMVLAELKRQPWTVKDENNVTVLGGVVHIWGLIATEAERRALVAAAESTPGVVAVRDHTLTIGVPPSTAAA